MARLSEKEEEGERALEPSDPRAVRVHERKTI